MKFRLFAGKGRQGLVVAGVLAALLICLSVGFSAKAQEETGAPEAIDANTQVPAAETAEAVSEGESEPEAASPETGTAEETAGHETEGAQSAPAAETEHDSGAHEAAPPGGHEEHGQAGHDDDHAAHLAGHGEEGGHGDEGGHHSNWIPPIWSVTAFVLMLLSIAVIPLVKPHWWEHNKNRAIVSAILGVPMAIYVVANDWVALFHSFHEYEQFIILLLSLFVISGGIWLSGDVRATPRNNAIFIAIGSILASFIGTTGAAMLLIRPLINTNSERKYVTHTVIFFIFMVANIGGSLTPLGDPPLFLGYLKGVPFTWTFGLWKFWLPTLAWLLILYFILDTYLYNKKESDESKKWDDTDIKPLRLKGWHNFFFLFGVVLSIYFYPQMKEAIIKMGVSDHAAEYVPVREAIMLLMAFLSWKTTNMEFRKAQNFTWEPIVEVAILFAAIFVTMIPALIILKHWGPTSPIKDPWHFFWITGSLSSFLDNAPTYLVFQSLGEGQGVKAGEAFVGLFSGGKVKEITLVAISVGAVFMGANTYIGNAPNFMVKSIAEENRVKMPSFFGYMAWSFGILIPTFIIITLIAFI